MEGTIIFQKEYDHSILDFETINDLGSESTVLQEDRLNAKELAQNLLESAVCIVMPERIEGKSYFIELAKDASAFYEMDTTITEYDDRLVVSFMINCSAPYSGLKKILLFSDEIYVESKNGKVELFIVYHTHAWYHSGRQVIPIPDF